MNYPMNRTDFTLHRYVDNEIDFMVKDVDRKTVSFTGANATLYVMDAKNQRLLLSRDLMVIDAAKGHLRLFVTGDEAAALPKKTLKYTVVMTRPDNVQVMLMMDRNRQSSGVVNVEDGPIPEPVAPIEITAEDFIQRNGKFYSGTYAGSAMVQNDSGLHSALLTLDDYTGDIVVQGSLEALPSQTDSDWFAVETRSFTHKTGTVHVPFEGNLMWVRFSFTKTNGELTSILYRN